MDLLNEKITKVIYINLEEAKERKESCLKILECIFDKDKIIRFNAIKDRYLGATKSHIECLELAIQNKWNNILIVEDDLKIYNENNNLKSLNTLYKLLNKKFDVILLGGTFVLYNPFNNQLYSCNNGIAYIVNQNYFKQMKNKLEEGLNKLKKSIAKNDLNYGRFIFDSYWRTLQIKDNWKICYPPIFIQISGYSYVNKNLNNIEQAFHNVNLSLIYKDLKKKKYLFLFFILCIYDILNINPIFYILFILFFNICFILNKRLKYVID